MTEKRIAHNADDSRRPFLPEGPVVMGILNVTPDSFYADSRLVNACAQPILTAGDTDETVASRLADTRALRERACQMAAEGAGVLDVGACSTRPGSQPVSEEEELRRLLPALATVREVLPEMPLSVDTFRRRVAEECVRRFGRLLINDVSGGEAALPGMPYVLTCTDNDPQAFFARRIPELRAAGIDELWLDPGFGFGKTLDDNYRILAELEALQTFGYPLLVGMSRKSMIYKVLGVTPEDALTGTVTLDVLALQKGASVLRVHDVLPAVQTVTLLQRVAAVEKI